MAPTKKTTPPRRTRQDIGKLSAEDVHANLLAAGIRPIEFCELDDELFYQHPPPRLEAWQRWDWKTYAPIARDPFVTSFYERNPADDLPTMWRKQLWDHETKTYIEGLTLPQLKTQLKTVSVDEWFNTPPKDDWTANQYRHELAARIRELEPAAVQTTKQRRGTT